MVTISRWVDVDLFDIDDKTFVHVDVLPGVVDDYLECADRHARAAH